MYSLSNVIIEIEQKKMNWDCALQYIIKLYNSAISDYYDIEVKCNYTLSSLTLEEKFMRNKLKIFANELYSAYLILRSLFTSYNTTHQQTCDCLRYTQMIICDNTLKPIYLCSAKL